MKNYLLKRIKKVADKEPLCRKLVELEPNSSSAQVLLANVLLKKGKKQEALDYLSRAIEINPNNQMAEWMIHAIH